MSDRVIANAIDRWVRDLTDLGGRNSLIYPPQVRDAALNLTPSTDVDAEAVRRVLNGQRVALSECFQTKRLADAARRGRAIARRAGWQAEETGLQTLYLGLGVVSWNVEDGPRPAAPLLLAGAELTPRGRLSEDFHIEIVGGWEPNLVLIQLLKNGFGADLSEQKFEDSLKTFESPAQIDDLFQTVADALDRACASVPGFRIEKTALLSNFSYAKRPMVRDLEESAYAIREHLLVSALAGYALGGGCELAMACDIIIAADNARFGQPEIKLGVPPGLGGTQRLPRVAGKAKAMDLCLTARMMDADEAERSGLVSRVVPLDRLLDEAMEAAAVIASMSRPAVLMVKEAIDRAYETTLESGLDAERGLFNMAFSSADKHEGMRAFLEKRAARWEHR